MKKSDISSSEQLKKLNGEFVRKLQILMAHRLRRINKRIL